MQIVTLAQVKLDQRITTSGQDAELTLTTEDVEYEVLAYLGASSWLAFVDAIEAAAGTDFGTDDAEYLQAQAIVRRAVLVAVGMRREDKAADIWTGKVLTRLLAPYRVAAFSSGTASS